MSKFAKGDLVKEVATGDLTIPPSGTFARLTSTESAMDDMRYREWDIPQARVVYGAIENLPETESGVLYIVSMPAAQELAKRDRFVDMRYPDTGKGAIRYSGGNITGTTRLLQAFPDDPKYQETFYETEVKLHQHMTAQTR